MRFALRWFFRRYWFRQRRRCPKCVAIGTFRAHDQDPAQPWNVPDRILCKWCGWYEDAGRAGWAHACNHSKAWRLEKCDPKRTSAHFEEGERIETICVNTTPQELLMVPFAGREKHWPLCNPWKG